MSASMTSDFRPSGVARPLRWWSGEQLMRLALASQRAVNDWQQAWGVDPTMVQDPASCRMAFEDTAAAGLVPANWKPLLGTASEADRAIWWDASANSRPTDASASSAAEGSKSTEADLLASLLVTLFGLDAAPHTTREAGAVTSVAADVAKSAWADLWRRIRDAFQMTTAAEPAERRQQSAFFPRRKCFQPWSGAVVITFHWCGWEVRVLLGGSEVEVFLRHEGCVADPRSSTEGVRPLWDAVSPLAFEMRAELEPVELSLGAVRALRIGDVVELTHLLDSPILAKIASGHLLCEAYLGKAGSHRAIELSRSPSNSVS
jgi:hypothetical protein